MRRAQPHVLLVSPLLALSLALLAGCRSETGDSGPAGDPEIETTAATADPQAAWWTALTDLCGDAYAGHLVSTDETDAAIATDPMVAHVRDCAETEVRIPFHVGDNRSRTWVITRTGAGIQLRHVHRHVDGELDPITGYGGHTDDPGTATTQSFPADDASKALFAEHGLEVSRVNVWSFELVPGERLSYVLRRPGRWFQADFDLTAPVPPPPPAW